MQLKDSLNKAFEKIKAIFELIGVFVEWLLADATCKYGTDWKRPIYLWLGVVFSAQSYFGLETVLLGLMSRQHLLLLRLQLLIMGAIVQSRDAFSF